VRFCNPHISIIFKLLFEATYRSIPSIYGDSKRIESHCINFTHTLIFNPFNCTTLSVISMNSQREHSSKIVLVSFQDGEYWEEWELRFNRGNKQYKPIKFFSTRSWRSDISITLCPFGSLSFDCASEKTAEERFVAEMLTIKGQVFQSTFREVRNLRERFGYEPVSETREGWV